MAVNNLEQKLTQIVEKQSSSWKEDAKWRIDNHAWLSKSAHIALQVLDRLDELGWTQKQLAEKMNTTPQYISKLCKGQENLTLKNISNLESVLNISIDTQSLDNFVSSESNDNITSSNTQSFSFEVDDIMSRQSIEFNNPTNSYYFPANSKKSMQLNSNSSISIIKAANNYIMSA